MLRSTFNGLLLIGVSTLGVFGQHTPVIGEDYSGLALMSDNAFITVSDRKTPIHPGYRVGLLTITSEDGATLTPITVQDWKDGDKAPSDLEACCPVPDRPYEFLLAEGGLFNGKFGRIFHVTLSTSDEGTPVVLVNGVMRIYHRKLDEKQRSFSGDQVQGIECFKACGKTFLAYGERGGKTYGGTKVGTIVWGELDLDTYRFQRIGESPLVSKSILGDRDCSALHLIPNDDQSLSVLSVATSDPGDNGPFNSVIYMAGRFVRDEQNSTVGFVREKEPLIKATLSGVKVEGLAPPASHFPKSSLSVSTDDENLGAIWRAVTAVD